MASAMRGMFAGLGSCPNCGADPYVKVVTEPSSWLISEAQCSSECWRQDPDAYLAAVSA